MALAVPPPSVQQPSVHTGTALWLVPHNALTHSSCCSNMKPHLWQQLVTNLGWLQVASLDHPEILCVHKSQCLSFASLYKTFGDSRLTQLSLVGKNVLFYASC